jgi:hypothetical protein
MSSFTALPFSDPSLSYLHSEPTDTLPKISKGGQECTIINQERRELVAYSGY